MPEAVHLVEGIDSPVNMNSTSFATRMTLSAAELAAAGFVNNDEALVLFWGLLSTANVGSEQVWRVTYNGSSQHGTNPRFDHHNTTGVGSNVGWFGRVSLGTLADLDFDNQRQGTSANVTVQKARLGLIRLADFGTENTDWLHNKSTTNVAHTTTYSSTNRASVTWTPDEVCDWIVLMHTHIAVDSTSVNAEARAMLDGSTLVCGDWSEEGSSTSEEWSMWTWGVLPSLTTTSHTVAVETRDDTATAANDHRESTLFIFKANQWPDLFYHLNSNTAMAATTDTQLATVTSSISANQNALILGRGHMIQAATTGGWMWVRQGGSTIIDPVTDDSQGTDDASWDAKDTTSEPNVLWMGYRALTSGAQDLDLFGHQADTNTRTMNAPGLLVWGMQVAGGAAPIDWNVELATEKDVAAEAVLRVEGVLNVEAAVEVDIAHDVVMAVEQEFVVEAASEEDVAEDVELAVDTGMAAEEAEEEDHAEDTVMVTEPVLTVEAASEADTAHDVVLQTAPAFDVEAASEEDTAHDVALTVAEVFTVEAASEVDEAHDVVLAVEQVFTVEPASEEDHAEDVSVGAAVGMEVEPASEDDLAEDILLQAEPLLDVEPATEEDTAHDVVLAVEQVFVVETASEEDRASDVDMASVSGFGVEQAYERDQAHEVVLAVEPVFVVEPASEEDTAHEAVMAVEQEFEVEPAEEKDEASDVEMGAVVGINVEPASEVDVAHDVVMVTDLVFPVEPAAEVDHAHDVIFVSVVVFVVEDATEVDRAFDVVMDNSDVIVLASPVCGIEGPHGIVGLVTIRVRHDVTGPEAAGSLTGPGGAAASIGPASTCGIDD